MSGTGVNGLSQVSHPSLSPQCTKDTDCKNTKYYSGAPLLTIRTEPQACIEIENQATLFFMVNMASSMVHATNDNNNVAQHGGHTLANTKSYSLGLCVYIFNNGHPCKASIIDTCQNKVSTYQYHITILRAQV